jgi:hypothetical protein
MSLSRMSLLATARLTQHLPRAAFAVLAMALVSCGDSARVSGVRSDAPGTAALATPAPQLFLRGPSTALVLQSAAPTVSVKVVVA